MIQRKYNHTTLPILCRLTTYASISSKTDIYMKNALPNLFNRYLCTLMVFTSNFKMKYIFQLFFFYVCLFRAKVQKLSNKTNSDAQPPYIHILCINIYKRYIYIHTPSVLLLWTSGSHISVMYQQKDQEKIQNGVYFQPVSMSYAFLTKFTQCIHLIPFYQIYM